VIPQHLLVHKESLNESPKQKGIKEDSQSADVTRKQVKVLLVFNVQSNRQEKKAEMKWKFCLYKKNNSMLVKISC